MMGLFVVWETSRALNKSDDNTNIAKENFKLAFNSAPYALVLSDREGIIMMANHHTEMLYGYTQDELIGRSVKLIIPSKMHVGYEKNRERFFEDGQVLTLGRDDEEMLALSKQGREFPIELILIPVQTEKGFVSMASIIDITDRRTYENIIKNQVTELQIKNQELEQFSYIASHDLQEPLRTVSNYIQLLEEDYPQQINGEIKEHLKVMDAALQRMNTLVRSLLDFARLGCNKSLVLTDCNSVVCNVIADLNSLIKKSKGKIIVIDTLPVIYAYETELRQLFQNLINNAVKFQKEGLEPVIKIGCTKRDGFVEMYVQDNGIGIDTAYSDRIFNIFQRLHRETEYEGHGIGLANCKKIVDMHGGKIWVESSLETGSTFKFTLLNLKA